MRAPLRGDLGVLVHFREERAQTADHAANLRVALLVDEGPVAELFWDCVELAADDRPGEAGHASDAVALAVGLAVGHHVQRDCVPLVRMLELDHWWPSVDQLR